MSFPHLPILIRRALAALALTIALAGCATLEASLAPDADPWHRWSGHDAHSNTTIDHTAWDKFLKTYLRRDASGLNRFAYDSVLPADRTALDAYVDGLRSVLVSTLNRNEQKAYWINLYNALTVQLVLRHYPVASIQDISLGGGLLTIGPWDEKLIAIEDTLLSLNDIEHRILRPLWLDNRIHYAVNCASIGCPNLRRDAYTGSAIESQLEQAAMDYVNDPRGVRLTGGRLVASKIYLWFQADFGGSESAVLDHLTRYAKPILAARLARRDGIDGYAYDWRLNAVR